MDNKFSTEGLRSFYNSRTEKNYYVDLFYDKRRPSFSKLGRLLNGLDLIIIHRFRAAHGFAASCIDNFPFSKN